MRKLFGITQYPSVRKGNVEVKEEYLQLGILNMWDFLYNKFAVYHNGFTYIVQIKSLDENDDYHVYRYAFEDDLTKEEIKRIEEYIKRKGQ